MNRSTRTLLKASVLVPAAAALAFAAAPAHADQDPVPGIADKVDGTVGKTVPNTGPLDSMIKRPVATTKDVLLDTKEAAKDGRDKIVGKRMMAAPAAGARCENGNEKAKNDKMPIDPRAILSLVGEAAVPGEVDSAAPVGGRLADPCSQGSLTPGWKNGNAGNDLGGWGDARRAGPAAADPAAADPAAADPAAADPAAADPAAANSAATDPLQGVKGQVKQLRRLREIRNVTKQAEGITGAVRLPQSAAAARRDDPAAGALGTLPGNLGGNVTKDVTKDVTKQVPVLDGLASDAGRPAQRTARVAQPAPPADAAKPEANAAGPQDAVASVLSGLPGVAGLLPPGVITPKAGR